MRRLLAIAAMCVALAGPPDARGEGWVVITLGTVPTADECLDRARIALLSAPAGRLDDQEWAIFGYDLADPALDAVITCRAGPGGQEAVLVLYGVRDDALGRRVVSESIRYFWQRGR